MDVWKIEKDVCRCCHSEGSFKSLCFPCIDDQGQHEVYLHLLQESFDIVICPVNITLSNNAFNICEDCIVRLRDASIFKKQVLSCEEKFKQMYTNNLIVAAQTDVKEECVDDDDLEESDALYIDEGAHERPSDNDDDTMEGSDVLYIDESADMRYSDEDDDLPLKICEAPQKKGKKRGKSKKGTKSQRKSIEDDNSLLCSKGQKNAKVSSRTPKFTLTSADFTTDGATYTCKHCTKKYDRVNSLKYHIKTKHYKIARYICPYCKKEFMTPSPLTVHKLTEHNVDDRYKCNACKGTFNTKVQLRKHVNNFHMLGEKYKCNSCDYESFSFEGLYKHKFKHRTVKDFHCKFCSKSFLRKTTLDLHERIHTGDRRKVCSVCGQAFVQKASLNYHMAKYHPEVNF